MFYDVCYCSIFFFKQKTAYEMRISDWSSDVCSSDLLKPSKGAPVPVEEKSLLSLLDRQQAFGYTQEDIRILLSPMLLEAEEATGSMGNEIGRASCRERVCQYV